MKAVVVYESLWGNTAAVARAIADGLGPETKLLSTGEATPDETAGADLLVVGSPVLAFRMPSDASVESVRKNPEKKAPREPDLSQPSMRSWLDSLPPGSAHAAAFDTEVRGPWGSAAPAILKALEERGYRRLAEPEGFIVKGKFGPMKDGELERARDWGARLAEALAG